MGGITNVPDDSGIQAKAISEYNWLKHHLLLLGLVVFLVASSVYGIESLISSHADKQAQRYEALLKSTQDKATADQQAADARQKQADVREAQYQQMVVQLTGQLAQRQKQEQQVKQVASSLDAAGAAQHITLAVKGTATAQGNNVVMDLPTSQKVVADLEVLPLVRQDLSDVQALWGGAQSSIVDLKSEVADQKKQVADQKEIVVAQGKSCSAEKDALKADARKGKMKVGFFSAIGGFLIHILIGR